MVGHGSTYIVPQDRSFRGTLYFFGQVDSVPRGLAVHTVSISTKHRLISLETTKRLTGLFSENNLLWLSGNHPKFGPRTQ